MSQNPSNPPDRRQYSFRWRILFWIALPFIWITIVDSLAMLIAASRSR